MHDSPANPWPLVTLAVLLVVLIVGRMSAPSDVYDNAQPGPLAYTIDVAVNGQWLMQREPSGELATKPPMYPWLAALGVMATGQTAGWVFKLPSLMAFIVLTGLVFDLGRRSLGSYGGVVAAALWASQYHAFKLMYTARPDMLLTMFVALGLWSVQIQRGRWCVTATGGAEQRPKVPWLIVVFWLAVAGGMLTKGPPALLAVAWLLFAVVSDRAWRRCRPYWQVAGLILAAALILAWLVPVMRAYPQWSSTMSREVVERAVGVGSGAHRHTPRLAVPAYFLSRFAPWSALCVLAAVTFRRWRPELRLAASPTNVRWALWWIALVLVVFLIPRGKRADYILPAYVGGAVLAAAMIEQVIAANKRAAATVGFLLGASGVGGVGVFVATWVVPVPQILTFEPQGVTLPAYGGRVALVACGFLILGAAVTDLLLRRRRQFMAKTLAATLVVAGVLGAYQRTYSRAVETRGGDYVHAIGQQARAVRDAEHLPLLFHDVDKTPVEALLGSNRVGDESFLQAAATGAVLIISERAWQEHSARFGSSAEIIMRAPQIPEAAFSLLLVRIPPPS